MSSFQPKQSQKKVVSDYQISSISSVFSTKTTSGRCIKRNQLYWDDAANSYLSRDDKGRFKARNLSELNTLKSDPGYRRIFKIE